MAEDGKIYDSVYFSAKAAEVAYKRLSLLSPSPVGEIEFNGLKIEFCSTGEMKVLGGFRVVVEDDLISISPPQVSAL